MQIFIYMDFLSVKISIFSHIFFLKNVFPIFTIYFEILNSNRNKDNKYITYLLKVIYKSYSFLKN